MQPQFSHMPGKHQGVFARAQILSQIREGSIAPARTFALLRMTGYKCNAADVTRCYLFNFDSTAIKTAFSLSILKKDVIFICRFVF